MYIQSRADYLMYVIIIYIIIYYDVSMMYILMCRRYYLCHLKVLYFIMHQY